MINTMMNKKQGLIDSVSCPTMEIPGCQITNSTLVEPGGPTDKKLWPQPTESQYLKQKCVEIKKKKNSALFLLKECVLITGKSLTQNHFS